MRRWVVGICIVVLTLGTALSLIATGNSFYLGFSWNALSFVNAGLSSLPASLALLAAGLLRTPRRRFGFIVGALGATAGLVSIAYQSTFLVMMESGYVIYGLVLGACLLALRTPGRPTTPIESNRA